MSERHRAGRATGSLLLLLILIAGLGGWNYHRNWQIEQETEGTRPYQSYAAGDLEALRDAYASELDGVQARFEAAKRQRVRPNRELGSITENVEQFRRTSQTSRTIRDAAAGVAERQSQLIELDRELELRARFGVGMARHVKRLITL